MSADTLRERLEKLVEEIERDIPVLQASKSIKHRTAAGTLRGVRAKLAAILAESEEREPDPFDAWHCPCHSGSVCVEACKRGQHHGGCIAGEPDPDRDRPSLSQLRKAKLTLGHEFMAATAAFSCGNRSQTLYVPWCANCGQPRAAHSPQPAASGLTPDADREHDAPEVSR